MIWCECAPPHQKGKKKTRKNKGQTFPVELAKKYITVKNGKVFCVSYFLLSRDVSPWENFYVTHMVGDDWFRSKVVTALLARGDGNAGGCFTASERWGGGFHSFKDTHWYMYDVSFNIGKFRLIHYFLFHFKCQKAYIIVNLLKENIFFIFFSFLSVYADKKNC